MHTKESKVPVLTNQESTLLLFLAIIIVIWIAIVVAYIKLVIEPDNYRGNRLLLNENTTYAVQTFDPQ